MSSLQPESLFVRQGECFLPTTLAGSPWHSSILHGGAPAALLAYCFEVNVEAGFSPARLSIDLLRPVPKAPLNVTLESIRQGKRIQLWQARLEADGVLVALANALFVQSHPVDLPEYAPQTPALNVLPDQLQDIQFGKLLFGQTNKAPPGLHTTVRIRPLTKLRETGQGCAWLSLPVPVIKGVVNTPFMLVALASDFGNGIGQLNLGNSTGTINADILLQLSRPAEGEWIALSSEAVMDPMGVGQVTSILYDIGGRIGQVVQTIMPMSEMK